MLAEVYFIWGYKGGMYNTYRRRRPMLEARQRKAADDFQRQMDDG